MNRQLTAMAGLCVVILATGVTIEHYAHGWWTYTKTFSETFNAYVCTAEHRDYRVVGIDNRTPLIDFPAMGMSSDAATDGTLIWRVADSVANYIERSMNIRWAGRHHMWRWNDVPWALIDSHGGGKGRWFAIEWHTTGGTPAVTAIYLDSIMSAR